MLKFFNRLCSVHLLIYSGDSFIGLIYVCVCVCVCVCVFITSRHTSFYFTLLCNTSQIQPVFYILKFSGNPMLSKTISIIFFFFQWHWFTLYLCVTLWKCSQYFKCFHYYSIFYGVLCSVIFDVTALAH